MTDVEGEAGRYPPELDELVEEGGTSKCCERRETRRPSWAPDGTMG